MLAMTPKRLAQIRRASRWLQFLFVFLSVFFVVNRLSVLVHPVPANTRTLDGVVFQGAAITGKVQILWLAQVALGAALSLKVLYHLVRLLGLYSQGKLFTAQNVARLRRIGIPFAFAPLVWLIALVGAWPEIAAAQDQWLKIMPTFPGGDLIAGCIFLYASRIVNEGRELRDEQDLTI